MTPEALRLWKERRAPDSHWRRAAIAAIGLVVNSASPALLADDMRLLAAIDAAYPFGERRYLPYKMWLLERKLFREACTVPPPMPTQDEIEACEVARDLVELGRYDEARELLDKLAPNRLNRDCQVCGATFGISCAMAPPTPQGIVVRMTVPHHARLVGHADAGPRRPSSTSARRSTRRLPLP